MDLHQFAATKNQLEIRLQGLIAEELERFNAETGVCISSVSVELHEIQECNGFKKQILGRVSTEVDLSTLRCEVAPALATPTATVDYIPHGWPKWIP